MPIKLPFIEKTNSWFSSLSPEQREELSQKYHSFNAEILEQSEIADIYITENKLEDNLSPREMAEFLFQQFSEYAKETELDNKQIRIFACLAADAAGKERDRAVKIAYLFHKDKTADFESKKKANNELAFISRDIANECRLVGNAISGKNALTADEPSYWEQVKWEINNLN